ncbi:MAG TPA: hypothetical protein DCS48_07560, partial [Desulfovibrio sp.]|nr:hypothetical protein [Desulfovibrio sp.]
PIDLNIQAETVADNESLALTISDLPEGSSLSAGVENEDGSWSLEPGETEGLQLNTPEDFSGEFSLTVTAIVEQDGKTLETSRSMDVTVEAAPEPVVPMSDGAQAYMNELGVNDEGNEDSIGISEQAQDYADQLSLQIKVEAENNTQPDAQELGQTLSGEADGDNIDTLISNQGEDYSEGLAGDQTLEDPIPTPQDDVMEQGNENADLLIMENEMG